MVLLVFALQACHPSTKMEYKLSDERMAHLMFDLQLADVTLTDLSPAQQDSIRQLFDLRITEVYHLSKEDIRSELDKLQSDPEKLKKIMGRVKEMADSIQ